METSFLHQIAGLQLEVCKAVRTEPFCNGRPGDRALQECNLSTGRPVDCGCIQPACPERFGQAGTLSARGGVSQAMVKAKNSSFSSAVRPLFFFLGCRFPFPAYRPPGETETGKQRRGPPALRIEAVRPFFRTLFEPRFSFTDFPQIAFDTIFDSAGVASTGPRLN